MITKNQNWDIQKLLFWNCFALFLLSTLFIPPFINLWREFDISFFRWINQPIKDHAFIRIFYALSNHRLADWFEDICILGFYFAAVKKLKKEDRSRRLAELIFCVLITAATIILINRFLCRDLLRLRRASPSLIVPNTVSLTNFFTWIQVKADSGKSFPGDHATTALMFACSYAYLVRGKLAIFALAYGLILCIPRLGLGAHWFSDVAVGSGTIIILVLSWAFFTPFAGKCIYALEKLLEKVKKKKHVSG